MVARTSVLLNKWMDTHLLSRRSTRDHLAELRSVELARQQYTANVTHELKTPLTSISGAAELLRDGLVRPEDVGLFAERILDESSRLTGLVDDILILSRLDESERLGDRTQLGTVGRIDLYSLALAVVDRREQPAFDAHVDLDLSGDHVDVVGNTRLLEQLMGNLIDNSIRYNREGGSVDVWVGERDGAPTLVVADTGQGIPYENQAKVFERFYRVDSGRSRMSGGTGLGLAIVKHAAAFHDATISLESEPGVGTRVTVVFPQPEGSSEVG
ncbi:MAG: hypothetical protein IJH87_06405 [Atopobiaceae bacterium]|nr:hypothetical protein [Atopobiaceae bacterium]